ncbi:hypothetical protein ES332_D10G262400v1 [Gossypium tomentosum]|uniref:Uncharacterized protein n=1 Tax=Gossypium tomentosum TaxID=34277 RepID=A0A5D2JA37_GOSTO|nr:hypothetical protein ES332_D10G262400v1 [Gossypium tomentosum]
MGRASGPPPLHLHSKTVGGVVVLFTSTLLQLPTHTLQINKFKKQAIEAEKQQAQSGCYHLEVVITSFPSKQSNSDLFVNDVCFFSIT